MRIDEMKKAAESLGVAACAEDVFGAVTEAEMHATYRRLAKCVHPDLFPGEEEIAGKALGQLTQFRDNAVAKFAAGTYGDRVPFNEAPKPPEPAAPVTIKVGKRTFEVGAKHSSGDVADLYACKCDAQEGLVLKLAQNAADNDLIEAESKVLKALCPSDAPDNGFYRYLPRYFDGFMVKTAKSTRRANVLHWYPEHMSLLKVKKHFPTGLDYRDAAWVINRVLEVLGHVHRQGWVHGAVLPPHVIVHPANHGAKLVDWCYSQPSGGRVRAFSAFWKEEYPLEILNKQPVLPQSDVFMAAELALWLVSDNAGKLRSDVPKTFTRLFEGCLLTKPLARPGAWQLLDEFAELMLKLVGKPAFRELVLK